MDLKPHKISTINNNGEDKIPIIKIGMARTGEIIITGIITIIIIMDLGTNHGMVPIAKTFIIIIIVKTKMTVKTNVKTTNKT